MSFLHLNPVCHLIRKAFLLLQKTSKNYFPVGRSKSGSFEQMFVIFSSQTFLPSKDRLRFSAQALPPKSCHQDLSAMPFYYVKRIIEQMFGFVNAFFKICQFFLSALFFSPQNQLPQNGHPLHKNCINYCRNTNFGGFADERFFRFQRNLRGRFNPRRRTSAPSGRKG